MTMHARVRFQAHDILDAPEDDKRYEVIDGKWCMSPAPSRLHQQAVTGLTIMVGSHVKRHSLGVVYTAPIGVFLDAETGLQPDLVYVSNARRAILTDDGIEGAPDLVVEVLSPSTEARDRGVKMRLYAAAGVPHLWLGVPATYSIEAYRLGAMGYELTGVYGSGTVFRPEVLPGLEIVIDDLWS